MASVLTNARVCLDLARNSGAVRGVLAVVLGSDVGDANVVVPAL